MCFLDGLDAEMSRFSLLNEALVSFKYNVINI